MHSIICVTYLWLYRLNFCIPNLESMDPFDTGNDSKLAISKFIDDFSSSMYNDSISLSTNFGINFRFFSISATRCIRPSNSRRMAAACSSFESSFLVNRQKIELISFLYQTGKIFRRFFQIVLWILDKGYPIDKTQ